MYKEKIIVKTVDSIEINRSQLDINLQYQDGYYAKKKKQTTLLGWLDWLPSTSFKPEDKPFATKLFPQQNGEGYSGIVCLDFDKPEDPECLLAKLKASKHILCGGKSISGKGVWAFAFTKRSGKIDVDKAIYAKCKEYFEREFGHKLDKMMTSKSFGRTASYDSSFFVKERVNILVQSVKIVRVLDNSAILGSLSKGNGHKYVDKVFYSLISTAEGNRNSCLFKAAACLKRKIDEKRFDSGYVLAKLKAAGLQMGLPEHEVLGVLRSAGFNE